MSTNRPTIRKYTLVVEGDTTDDFDQALAEATRLLTKATMRAATRTTAAPSTSTAQTSFMTASGPHDESNHACRSSRRNSATT